MQSCAAYTGSGKDTEDHAGTHDAGQGDVLSNPLVTSGGPVSHPILSPEAFFLCVRTSDPAEKAMFGK